MRALAARGIKSHGLHFGKLWRTVKAGRLEDTLARASHLLVLYDEEIGRSSWFAFVAGYARASRCPMSILTEDKDWEPEAWLGDINYFHDINRMAGHFYSMVHEWSQQEKRIQARAALLEEGISWHTDSLIKSVKDGNLRAIGLFLDSGFLPSIRDRQGVPLLSLAVRARQLKAAELLLDRGAELDMKSDDRAYTALMDAVQLADFPMAEMLISRGASLDIQSKDGQTALILAVGRNEIEMSRALVKAGADLDIADKLGFSARKYASLFKKDEILAVFSSVTKLVETQ